MSHVKSCVFEQAALRISSRIQTSIRGNVWRSGFNSDHANAWHRVWNNLVRNIRNSLNREKP